MKRKLQKQSKNNSIIIYLILCVIVLFALLISRTVSKYVMKVEGNPIAQEATEFYFESELAEVELKEYKNNYWNGKLAIVLPHPSPLNKKWIKDHPKFINERIIEIRKIIKETIMEK